MSTTETIGDYNDDTEQEMAGALAEAEAYDAQEEEFDHSDDLLGEFLQAASEEVDNRVSFPVTSRKGDWSIDFSAVVTEAEIKRFDKLARTTGGNRSSRRTGGKGEFSNARMCGFLLADKCLGIYKGVGDKRTQVMDDEGDPLLLNSDDFLSSVGHDNDVQAAVRAFLGDAGTATMGGALLREAGWSEDLTPLDPTER